jgi:hypothetical protein
VPAGSVEAQPTANWLASQPRLARPGRPVPASTSASPRCGAVRERRIPGRLSHFAEHGRPRPARCRLQDPLTPPPQRLLAGGCHLNRTIDRLITESGLRLTRLGQNLPGRPENARLHIRGPGSQTSRHRLITIFLAAQTAMSSIAMPTRSAEICALAGRRNITNCSGIVAWCCRLSGGTGSAQAARVGG